MEEQEEAAATRHLAHTLLLPEVLVVRQALELVTQTGVRVVDSRSFLQEVPQALLVVVEVSIMEEVAVVAATQITAVIQHSEQEVAVAVLYIALGEVGEQL